MLLDNLKISRKLAIGLALAMTIAIGLGFLLTRMIAGPVNAMTAAMRRLTSGASFGLGVALADLAQAGQNGLSTGGVGRPFGMQ